MKHAFAIAALAAGCQKAKWDWATITVDGQPVRVEIAHTAELREIGLMERDAIGPDEGMLFMYAGAQNRSFWMKKTRIPLDIAFADANGTIVRISQMEPFATRSTPSLQPAKYALEMNEGWFAAHDVAVGDALTDLPTVVADP